MLQAGPCSRSCFENTHSEPVRPLAGPSTATVQTYLPLVHQIVGRFLRRVPPNVLRDDLVAAGTFGLVDALRKGGAQAGPTFEWYARIRIRGAIVDELRSQDWLTRRARRRVTRTTDEGARVGPRTAVVGFDDLPPDAIARDMADDSTPSPLEHVEQRTEHAALARAIEELPERERSIVRLHYFQGVPFKTIAASMRVSEPRVSQLHARAMGMLRVVLEREQREAAA